MFSSVYITVNSEHEAKGIAKSLLDKRLIACANLFPITSLYYWNDKFQEDKEIAMIMKTRTSLMDKLIEELKKIHPYEVPCIVSWNISRGYVDYLSWVEQETIKPGEIPDAQYPRETKLIRKMPKLKKPKDKGKDE